ncbi:conserved hypothetical protein [Thiomonas sp. X19]|uniref:hypothetical protein n=1 Tax=Thiomonas sp. X19 TaxID=1050370 RepID=UPI000B7085BF|nr:hypothetical protein [Thiomonas sp. X19]SCC95880.1 conserved hypothetical protein [Thiomonas sp. X19]
MTKPRATKLPPAASQDEAAFLAAQEQRIEQGIARAGAIARGNYQTAHVAEAFARRTFAETPLGDVARAIKQAGDAVSSGDLSGLEHILTGQIVALHGVFVDCAMRAQGNMGQYLNAAESYMRLALKAQAQCARTAEVLGNLRAGPTIFAKQANVTTGPQQVNNGNFESSTHARTHAQEAPKPANELLEDATHEQQQRMVPGAQAAPARGNQAVEAVGAVNRAEDARRQGQGGSQ